MMLRAMEDGCEGNDDLPSGLRTIHHPVETSLVLSYLLLSSDVYFGSEAARLSPNFSHQLSGLLDQNG